MLQIKNISKDYVVSNDLTVRALKNVSVNFRQNEFVSILGPSGCGKTTLLNIIGGLDRYTNGDLVINGKSTKGFKDSNWDAYRNHSVGFVFQSYNLIPHMNILDNVTLSLSLAGASKAERIAKAKVALEKVGLANQLKKRPNQLSGGQMQRVAIARALVNDPDIILADEPTGALDSETGVQVMELLKEISNDRLIIMVTHNTDLAQQYSTRIINLFDGQLTGDTNPYGDEQAQADQRLLEQKQVPTTVTVAEGKKQPKQSRKRKSGKVGMSWFTAFALSAKHLLSKRGRTFLTSFAGSIGIFGITLVLAISGGMTAYVDNMQTDAVSGSAITISETTMDLQSMMNAVTDIAGATPYPQNTTGVTPYKNITQLSIKNNISQQYLDHIAKLDSSWLLAVDYSYAVKTNVLHKGADGNYTRLGSWSSYSKQMVSNGQLVEDNYDVLYKASDSATGYPASYTEVSLVVDRYNRLSTGCLNALGIHFNADTLQQVPYGDIVGKTYKVVLNDGWYYQKDNGLYGTIGADKYNEVANGQNAITLKIVSVLRAKGDQSTMWLSSGLAYLPDLTEFLLNNAINSAVGQAQLTNTDKNVLTGAVIEDDRLSTANDKLISALKNVSAYKIPTNISLYPTNIDAKQHIAAHLEQWNTDHPDDEVVFTDFSELILNMMSTLIDVLTYVLVAFSAVSLIVSTVMISVITYTSVVERIKEIGVLRSLGARKKDISGIFNAETTMIGALAGVIGIVFAGLLGWLVNVILYNAFEVSNIVQLTPSIALIMLALSVVLTLIAGLIPARIAANKDPVTCLRTE